jgi:hypothetical protein
MTRPRVERVLEMTVRQMTREQHRAYEQLRWGLPGPAERARLKKTLGEKLKLRRTNEETVALAAERSTRDYGRGRSSSSSA